MTSKDYANLLRYSDPHSILVVSWENRLMKIYCPFRVNLICDVGELLKGDKASVSSVMLSSNLKTVFVIEDKAYYYFYFDILI